MSKLQFKGLLSSEMTPLTSSKSCHMCRISYKRAASEQLYPQSHLTQALVQGTLVKNESICSSAGTSPV